MKLVTDDPVLDLDMEPFDLDCSWLCPYAFEDPKLASGGPRLWPLLTKSIMLPSRGLLAKAGLLGWAWETDGAEAWYFWFALLNMVWASSGLEEVMCVYACLDKAQARARWREAGGTSRFQDASKGLEGSRMRRAVGVIQLLASGRKLLW